MADERLRVLSGQLLDEVVAELRREAVALGRLEMLESLLPRLAAKPTIASQDDQPDVAIQRALALLRRRFRERVNQRLRELCPEQSARQSLRRALWENWQAEAGA